MAAKTGQPGEQVFIYRDSSNTVPAAPLLDVSGVVPSRAYDSQTAKYQRVSPTGASITESTKRLIGGGFASSLDSVAWTASNSGTGSASGVSNGIATLTSGTSNNGYGYISTPVKSRFLFASANNLRGTFRLPSLDGANTTLSWGAFNLGTPPAISDGFYFSYDGTTSTLSVNSINGGVVTNTASSGSFNGEVSSYTLDTNAHNFEILYQVVGVWFFVDGVLLHKFSAGSSMMSGTMQLSSSAIAKNSSAGTISRSLEVWAMTTVRFGAETPSAQYFHISANGTNVIKLGPTTLQRIILNTAGSNNNALTIYDNTAGSGTVVGVLTNALGTIGAVDYDLDLVNGLTIVGSGTTSGDFTIVYD